MNESELASIKIMIVEDDLALLRLYRQIFSIEGFIVVEVATNGRDAIENYIKLEKKPDVIIMDYHMPIMNGVQAMDGILRENERAKVVIVSADSNIKERAIARGAISFLMKPFDIAELIDEIQKCSCS